MLELEWRRRCEINSKFKVQRPITVIMSLKDSWKSLTPKEKVFLGAILVLLIAIVAKWDKISSEMGKGFDKYFGGAH